MKSSVAEILPIIGTAMGGGFYAGRIRIDGQAFALIVAPKAEGEHEDIIWAGDDQDMVGAKSYFDGLANTKAMAESGSELAQWSLALRIGGNDDWYLPAQDELEIIYRHLKPTTRENDCYARSGINVSALDPAYPYSPESPAQTQADAFKAGADEAFEPEWYWSSTQHSANSDYAWNQDFSDGDQGNLRKGSEFRARAVRRLPI